MTSRGVAGHVYISVSIGIEYIEPVAWLIAEALQNGWSYFNNFVLCNKIWLMKNGKINKNANISLPVISIF